jgi:hypothetical protein
MKSAEESVSNLVREGFDIRGRVDRNPYGMVAGALAVGYVMGGGIFTRLTERLAGAVLRAGLMAVLPRLEREFLSGASTREACNVGEKGE